MPSLCFFQLDTKTVQSSGNSELGVMQYVNLAEGHAAYHSHEDDSSQTQRIILKITKKAGVAETQQSDIEEIKKRKADSFQSKFNQAITPSHFPTAYGGCETLAGNGDWYHRGRRGECFFSPVFHCVMI